MKSTTLNKALSNATSGSKVLDFFGSVAALRKASSDEVIKRFTEAFNENPELALKCLFYARDVRGGQGERKVFRTLINYLATHNPSAIKHLVKYIPEFGRWDDVLELIHSPLESEAFDLILTQLISDVKNANNDKAKAPVSLLAKWMPSENASSSHSKSLARYLAKKLKRSPKEYRQMLAILRAHINVVERLLCNNKWDAIDYEKLPGRAGLIYRNAFLKHDESRYRSYLGEVTKGTAKIKTQVLYPYDIVQSILSAQMVRVGDKYFVAPVNKITSDQIQALDTYWNNLPNYFGKNSRNAIAVVDTSGSMRGFPIQVAVSLGIYIAERNNGPFKDHFISFSDKPKLQKVTGKNIVEKAINLSKTDWGQSTNLQGVFDLILSMAVKFNLKQEDLPAQVFIISDMQFNIASPTNNQTNLAAIQSKYEAAGYKAPELVFWNVNAINRDSPISKEDKFVKLVSGCNPSILTKLLSGVSKDAYQLMVETLNSPRYEPIALQR